MILTIAKSVAIGWKRFAQIGNANFAKIDQNILGGKMLKIKLVGKNKSLTLTMSDDKMFTITKDNLIDWDKAEITTCKERQNNR